jgi:hypothetical protein
VPRRKAKYSCLVNTTVETYSSHVIDNLIGIKGRDRADVVAFIIKSWIAEHREEIAGYGIKATVKKGELILG